MFTNKTNFINNICVALVSSLQAGKYTYMHILSWWILSRYILNVFSLNLWWLTLSKQSFRHCGTLSCAKNSLWFIPLQTGCTNDNCTKNITKIAHNPKVLQLFRMRGICRWQNVWPTHDLLSLVILVPVNWKRGFDRILCVPTVNLAKNVLRNVFKMIWIKSRSVWWESV